MIESQSIYSLSPEPLENNRDYYGLRRGFDASSHIHMSAIDQVCTLLHTWKPFYNRVKLSHGSHFIIESNCHMAQILDT